MKCSLTLFAVFILLFSCKDDDPIVLVNDELGNSEFDIQCFLDKDPDNILDTCFYDVDNDSITYFVFNDGRLSDAQKAWMPYFCLEDRSISFSNDQGDQISLTKNDDTTYEMEKQDGNDINDDGTTVYGCYRNERVQFSMELKNYEFPLIFSLVALAYDDDQQQNVSLQVFSMDDERNYPKITHFDFFSSDGIVNWDPSYGHTIFESIELNGKTFENVYGFRLDEQNANYLKLLYNKKYGIIRITDLDGVEWVLDE